MNPAMKDLSSSNPERDESPTRLDHDDDARRASVSSTKSSSTPLPADFVPSSYCVVCGKGKECFNAVGNRRFRVIIDLFLERYSLSIKKSAKSEIVSSVLQTVHQAGGRFVKKEKGQWVEISEAAAREKIGAVFRDSLHFQYRSSGKAKTARRRERRIVEKTQSRKRRQTSLSVQHISDLCAAPQPQNRRAMSAPPSMLGDYTAAFGVGDDELVKHDLIVAAAAAMEEASEPLPLAAATTTTATEEPIPISAIEDTTGQETRNQHLEGIGDVLFVEHDLAEEPESYFQGGRKKIKYNSNTSCAEQVVGRQVDASKAHDLTVENTLTLRNLANMARNNHCNNNNSRRSSGSAAPSLCEEPDASYLDDHPTQIIHL